MEITRNIFLLSLFEFCLSFNLCLLFGTCAREERINKNSRNGNSGEILGTFVDTNWIEPNSDYGLDSLYHFGHSATSMNWYEADLYCKKMDGYLVEPKTPAEHKFLKLQAMEFERNVNWWIGLREADSCQCAKNSESYVASLDEGSLRDPLQSKLAVSAICSPDYSLLCFGTKWVWSYSGDSMQKSALWNKPTGEPNGITEHCVVMWLKGDYNWGDWECTSKKDNFHQFKPLCQKRRQINIPDDYEYGIYDDYESNSTSAREDRVFNTKKCVYENLKFNWREKHQIRELRQIADFQHCGLLCTKISSCNYWVYHKSSGRCNLLSKVRRNNIHQQTDTDFISGKTATNCYPPGRNKTLCVSYNAIYRATSGTNKETQNDVLSAKSCKENCEKNNNCKFWTWRGDLRRKKCIMFDGSSYSIKVKKKSVSGSSLKICIDKPLEEINECECIHLKEKRPRNNAFNDFGIDLGNSGQTGLTKVTGQDEICLNGEVKQCYAEAIEESIPGTDLTEICGDYNAGYIHDQLPSMTGISSADVCRGLCLQSGTRRCKYFSWDTDNTCNFYPNNGFKVEIKSGAVSGSVLGSCSYLALSQLTECECHTLSTDLGDINYDILDQIDIRAKSEQFECGSRQAYRCKSGSPRPILRSRFQ